MYLKNCKKVNANRFTIKTKHLNSNFFKISGLLNNKKMRSFFFYKYKKKSNFYKKKFMLHSSRMLRKLNLYNFYLIDGYNIICTKRLSKSGKIVGLCEIQNHGFSIKNYFKYKKIHIDINTFKMKDILYKGSLFMFKMFYGYRLETLMFNENNVFNFFNYRTLSLGTPCVIRSCAIGNLIYDLQLLKKSQKFATSAGSYITILDSNVFSKTAVIELPSGLIKEVDVYSLCIVGRNANIYKKFMVFGKAGNRIHFKKKKISVRGIAMNPIDHPNGGRTKIKKPFRNVWGHVAKKKK